MISVVIIETQVVNYFVILISNKTVAIIIEHKIAKTNLK